MTLSLRTGLTAWFTALASLVVGASSVALYSGVRRAMVKGLDEMLEAEAKGVGALCEWEDGHIHLEGYYEVPGHRLLFEHTHGFEVRLLPRGELQVREGLPLPPVQPDHAEGARTYGDLRVVAVAMTFPPRAAQTVPRPEPGSPGFTVDVRTAASLLPIERQLATIRWFASLTAAAAIASVFAFSLFLARRVTQPLARLGRAATRARDGEVAPLPRAGNGDEIDRLAVLLDEAFAAVRGSVDRQKRFVADASHELRNPVAILASIAEIGQRRDRTVSEYRDLLAEVEQIARRMANMLNSLLTLARLDATGRICGPVVDLASLVGGVVAATQTTLQLELQSAPATVHGDANLLAMLCDNLLSNAVRHARTRIGVRVATEHDRVSLRIEDDGPGLSVSEIQHLFERFFRGSGAKGQGAGLGLALARSIARAHGGDCHVVATPNGLCIAVVLPAGADEHEPAAPPS